MRGKKTKFENILDNYIKDKDSTKTINEIKKNEILEFQKYLQERCNSIDYLYKNVEKENPVAAVMMEDKRELFHHLLENFENKNNLKPIDDIVKHIFTKLRVKLLVGELNNDDSFYKISIKLDNDLVDRFKYSMKNRLLCHMIFPVKVDYSDDTIDFKVDNRYLKNEKAFINFITKKISENKLSWVNDNLLSELIPFIKKNRLKKDIEKYSLDYMYKNSISPTINFEHNNAVYDEGLKKLTLPDNDHWAYKALISLKEVNNKKRKLKT